MQPNTPNMDLMQQLSTDVKNVEKKFDDRFQEFDNKIDIMNQRMERVLVALSGNDGIDKDDKGLIGKVNTLESRLKVVEKWKDRAVWVLIGATIPASYGVANFVSDILKALKK